MVKVYYSYCFDQAVGFASSRNANFAIDMHSTIHSIQENILLLPPVNIFFSYLSKQDKLLPYLIDQININLSDIYIFQLLKFMRLMKEEPLLSGISIKDNFYLPSNSIYQLLPGYVLVRMRLNWFLEGKMVILFSGIFSLRNIPPCTHQYI